MSKFSFEILSRDKETNARLGLIRTRRGDIETPYLVPVATLGSVRALGSDDLANLGVQCSLANTYHLHLKPGDELIKRLGGLHRFMGFAGPLFTDSGGFQAFSLGFGREHNISKIGNIFPDELSRVGSGEEKKEGIQDEMDCRVDKVDNSEGSLCQCSEEVEILDSIDPGEIYKLNYRRDYGENGNEGRERSGKVAKKGPKIVKKENLTRITDGGISFKSMADGAWHFLNAEKSMKIQSNLDSDIIMAFDECTSPLSDYEYTKKAMLRTHDWADQSIRYHDKDQAIYGIIQGGWFEDLQKHKHRSYRIPIL